MISVGNFCFWKKKITLKIEKDYFSENSKAQRKLPRNTNFNYIQLLPLSKLLTWENSNFVA